MMEKILVLGISHKKEMGWIKCAPAEMVSWADQGMKFDKAKFSEIFNGIGLFDISYNNTAGIGQNPAFVVTGAKKLASFDEIIGLVTGK